MLLFNYLSHSQGGGSVAWLSANIIFSWKKTAVATGNTVTKMTAMTLEPTLYADIFFIIAGSQWIYTSVSSSAPYSIF